MKKLLAALVASAFSLLALNAHAASHTGAMPAASAPSKKASAPMEKHTKTEKKTQKTEKK
jgi:Cu/Ag efflux protein CusF